jgi:hypothetical protein
VPADGPRGDAQPRADFHGSEAVPRPGRVRGGRSAERNGSRGASDGVGRTRCGPIPDTPRSFLPRSRPSVSRCLESTSNPLFWRAVCTCHGISSEAVHVDHGQFVRRRRKVCLVESAPARVLHRRPEGHGRQRLSGSSTGLPSCVRR